jgi:hypothetical protein
MIPRAMTGLGPNRGFVAVLLALWMLSGVAIAAHTHTHGHCDCGDCHHDEDAPCAICVAASFAPAIGIVKQETVEEERDVVLWILPWIALVPQDVFYDRPLARGPPEAF